MLEKSVVVYLDTGATREHVVLVEDDDAYVKKYNEFVDLLKDDAWSLLIFGEPLCIYRVQNIIAVGISDPPLSNKLPMGFMAIKRYTSKVRFLFFKVTILGRVKERRSLSYINIFPLSFKGEGETGGEVEVEGAN